MKFRPVRRICVLAGFGRKIDRQELRGVFEPQRGD